MIRRMIFTWSYRLKELYIKVIHPLFSSRKREHNHFSMGLSHPCPSILASFAGVLPYYLMFYLQSEHTGL